MCGLVGVVGKSKDINASYHLTTHLMRETQRRGPHSSGHYCVDEHNDVDFFKCPLPAKVYVSLWEWQRTKELNPKAIIGHARYKTQGGEFNNLNNHPHVSDTGNIGLIHNGVIHKYADHKKKYTLHGDSDSEMLLRIIVDKRNIIQGIKEVYNLFGSSGDFACMLIYRNPVSGKSRFFFFRDSGRPGRFVDASKELGQYFMFSVAPIWRDALAEAEKSCPSIKNLELDKLTVKIIPSFSIWEIDVDTLEIKKHNITTPKRETKPAKKTNTNSYNYSKWVKEDGIMIYKYESYNRYNYAGKTINLRDPNLLKENNTTSGYWNNNTKNNPDDNNYVCHLDDDVDQPNHSNVVNLT